MALTFNPYPEIGTQLAAGLNAIAAATPATVDDLVDETYAYIQPIFYPSSSSVPKAIEIEIKSVAYNMINAYNNKALGSTVFYGPQQTNLISMMLGLNTNSLTPINSLDHWFDDIEDNIGKANLTIDQQTPLLLAMECAKTIYAYWVVQVNATTSPWAGYFQTAGDRNYPNIPFWTEACIEGALLGANLSQKGLIAPTTDITSVNIVSALIGALAIGAGKVIFEWVPRIQPDQLQSINSNFEPISPSNPNLPNAFLGFSKTWGFSATVESGAQDSRKFEDKMAFGKCYGFRPPIEPIAV